MLPIKKIPILIASKNTVSYLRHFVLRIVLSIEPIFLCYIVLSSLLMLNFCRPVPGRRVGMTVLGRIAVPKPVNLPSQRYSSELFIAPLY